MISLQRASHRARAVHQALGIRSHQDLSHLTEICVARGAFVREEQLEGASARLVVQGRKGIISITPTRNPGRRRFSIAHELGHFEMHSESQSFWNCTDKDLSTFGGAGVEAEDDPEVVADEETSESGETERAQTPKLNPAERRLLQEKEANSFAAELLMPERLIKSALPHGRPRLEMIQDLSRQFEVSWLAMAYRFFEMLSEPCLMIVRPPGAEPTLMRSPAFRRAGKLEVLAAGESTPTQLSQWVRFVTDGAPDSLVQVDTEIKPQTGTRVDLLWAPEFSA